MTIMSTVRRFLPVREAEAHCDIPCGIYDPIQAKIAAQTVVKMVMRIQTLAEQASSDMTTEQLTAARNTGMRYIAVKEEHAQVVKNELDILWHDYFNPTHLEKYPDLHTAFWNANKLAGANKQNVNLESAQQLVEAVDAIAEMFWATKGVEYSDPNAAVRFGS